MAETGALQDWLKGLSFEVEVDSWLRMQARAAENGRPGGSAMAKLLAEMERRVFAFRVGF